MKRIFVLVLALALCCLALPALAGVSRIADNAELLTEQEEQQLLASMTEIEQKHDLPIILLTTPSIGNIKVNLYAADAFEIYVGYEKDGLLFLLDMGERDYFTLTSGKAIRAFTDWGLDRLHEAIVPDLSAENYAKAFSVYLTKVEDYMVHFENGEPYDVPNANRTVYEPQSPQSRFTGMLPAILIASFILSLIVVLCMKSRMKTVRKKDNATSYAQDFDLTRVQDIYLYTTTTRRKIETDSGSRGGSSTFKSSSGGSYGGKGGKF